MLYKLGNQAQVQRSILGTNPWVDRVGLAIAVGVGYFLAAQLGLALLTTPERVAVFWPASGIAVGTLIALGPHARGPVAAGNIAHPARVDNGCQPLVAMLGKVEQLLRDAKTAPG